MKRRSERNPRRRTARTYKEARLVLKTRYTFEASDLHGTEALEVAITAFNEANKDVVSWSPDYSRAIIIDKADLADLLPESQVAEVIR